MAVGTVRKLLGVAITPGVTELGVMAGLPSVITGLLEAGMAGVIGGCPIAGVTLETARLGVISCGVTLVRLLVFIKISGAPTLGAPTRNVLNPFVSCAADFPGDIAAKTIANAGATLQILIKTHFLTGKILGQSKHHVAGDASQRGALRG
jgi:hypothetical protein